MMTRKAETAIVGTILAAGAIFIGLIAVGYFMTHPATDDAVFGFEFVGLIYAQVMVMLITVMFVSRRAADRRSRRLDR